MIGKSKILVSLKEIDALMQTLRLTGTGWKIARPLAAIGVTRWNAIRGAVYVLMGKAVAIRWY